MSEGERTSSAPDGAAKVYVLETGMYDTRGLAGIFATPEMAMAAHSPKRDARASAEETYSWSADDVLGQWVFDADYDDYATVYECTVSGANAPAGRLPDPAGVVGEGS